MRRRTSLFSLMFVAVVAGIYMVLALLGKVPSPLKDIKNTLSGTASISGDALYSELSKCISSPDRESILDGKFTVTVYVTSEAEEVVFEDDEDKIKHLYQSAWISRNDDSDFLLDVKDLDEPLEPEKLYSITGSLDGNVYWTEDNEKVTLLDVLVAGAKPFEPEDVEANEGPDYVADDGVYTFLGAHKSSYRFGTAIVVYFDFKNTGSDDAAPSIRSLTFYQGASDETTGSVIFAPDDVDPGALSATEGIPDKTYAGKTQRYYAVFEWDSDMKEDADNFYLVRSNDDFVVTDDIVIPISKSYQDWKK